MAKTPERAVQARYSLVAILLHWVIAAAIIAQFVLATRMGGRTPEAFALVQLHKSIGVTILVLSLARLAWRLTHRPPPEPPLDAWERTLSRLVHIGFYVIMIAMPLTGWLMVSTSRLAVPTLLYGVVPWPHLPIATADKALAHEVGETGHYVLALTALALLALHVAGALKHQLFGVNEPVLSRMAPGARSGRWAEPRLFLIGAGVLAAVGFAGLVAPPVAHRAPAPVAVEAPPRPNVARTPVAPLTPEPPEAVTPEAPTSAEPLRWTVSPGSSLEFATSWGDQPIVGRFQTWAATILFSPKALDRSQVTVVVDLGSVDTGEGQRDEALRSEDWFAAGRSPEARFVATRFEARGGDRYLARGQLELRGVKRPLAMPFTLRIDGAKATAEGNVTVDRTVFGVGQGEFAVTDQIPGAVKVRFRLTATSSAPRQPAPI